jgi:hypothetical protein
VAAVNGVASLAEFSSGSASFHRPAWGPGAVAAVSVESAASGRISGRPALVKNDLAGFNRSSGFTSVVECASVTR